MASIKKLIKSAPRMRNSLPKKAQDGVKASADSSSIYKKRMLSNMDMADRSKGELKDIFTKKWQQNAEDLKRQSKKGKPGYDKDGFPIKKERTGGKVPNGPLVKKKGQFKGSTLKKGGKIKK